MGGKNSPPPPPDYTPIAQMSAQAAKLQYKLGKEQLAWAREQYAMDRKVADTVIGAQLETMRQNNEFAVKDRARYEEIFQPLEDDLAREALEYGSPERKAYEMGRAKAGVTQAFGAARENAMRNLESYGINPNSTRFAALDIGTRSAEAAASAAAGTQAGERTDAVRRALRSEAINVGKGYPGQIAGAYGTGVAAGNQAVNSGIATTASGAATMGTAPQYQALGNNSLQTWGNTLNMGYQNQLAAYNAQQQASSGWGSLLGGILGAASSPIRPWYLSEGGEVPDEVSPSKGLDVDDVHTALTAGEFVLPKDVVEWYGQKHMYGLIEKADKERAMALQVTEAVPAKVPPQPQRGI